MTRRHQAGFTIAEIVITLAIITIALVPISASIVHGYNRSSQAAYLTQAAFLARHLAEEVLAAEAALLYDAVSLTQDSPLPFPGYERFSYTRSMHELDLNLLRVEVCIFWHNYGQEHRYRVVTLID
ncbi:MAG TPA: prepilin-type N-terminal cleavage/methylation domain-containing protein [Bacillota bacterium]|nr:prepilin-type N-terminal cleavage/methylation domain-containing protein [Bacillota bacterium]